MAQSEERGHKSQCRAQEEGPLSPVSWCHENRRDRKDGEQMRTSLSEEDGVQSAGSGLDYFTPLENRVGKARGRSLPLLSINLPDDPELKVSFPGVTFISCLPEMEHFSVLFKC